jgi:type I restriction enzyme M protein
MYVDETDGYALVVKAGSNISKFGELVTTDADYIEKSLYDEYLEKSVAQKKNFNLIEFGDILLSSTGDGTLGKCCVYRSEKPAVADGHVTIIRVDPNYVHPEYLCDYLRSGFGARQIERLYTGSTGLVELTPDHVDAVFVNLLESDTNRQQTVSTQLREAERKYLAALEQAEKDLEVETSQFLSVEVSDEDKNP